MAAFPRALLFGAIAFIVPLAACKLFSKEEEAPDAAPPVAPSSVPAATATAPAAPPLTDAAPAPAASGSGRRVSVKLPDGGTALVDASVGPDGNIIMPPGFQFPTFPMFDAAALKFPAFDAASLPPLPSGFPKIPGFGPDGGK